MEDGMRMTEALAAKAAAVRWGVVTSHPHAERLAKENLERQGFEVYMPMMLQAREPTKANKWSSAPIIKPFLPGYLFVQLNPSVDRWRCVFSTRGVKSLMLAGERPALVGDADLDKIRGREEGGFIKMMRPEDAPKIFARGDAVKIRDGGPFDGWDAVFEQYVDKNRCLVFLMCFGRLTGIQVTPLALR